MRSVILKTLLFALIPGVLLGALLGDTFPKFAAGLACPQGYDRVQIVSSSRHLKKSVPSATSPAGRRTEINSTTYCVSAGSYADCVRGAASCSRLPVGVLRAFGPLFLLGWLVAMLPIGVFIVRRRAQRRG